MFTLAVPSAVPPASLRARIFAGLIFGPWNALFLSLVFFGLAPSILLDPWRDDAWQLIPWEFTLFLLVLVCVPVFSVVLGVRWMQQPRRLLGLFYGLEVPLCLACVLRLFLVRELTPGMGMLLSLFTVAALAFGWELAFGGGERKRWQMFASLCAQTVALLSALYLAAVLAFYVPIVATETAVSFFSFEWVRWFTRALFESHGRALLVFLLSTLLLAFTAVLFVGAPVGLVWLYLRSFRAVFQRARAMVGTRVAGAVAGVTLAVVTVLSLWLNAQPQRKVFELLEHAPRMETERALILDKREEVRAGLVQAYLAPYRFWSPRGENKDLARMYERVLHASPEIATAIQRAQNVLLAPMLYDGDKYEQDRAAKLYAELFDTPIQKGERESILRALATTWERDERQAGLLNQDQRQVKLVRQEVRVEESGATATVEIHDQYENQTFEEQEVLLHFTLPQSAVVTGLWLGNGKKEFAYSVSPRGAAQKVYRNEVARRVDPALIEQVGPGQYRLRAFPIPPRPRDLGPAPSMHLWLSYATVAEGARWPAPHLFERRNLFWDDTTERVLGGKTSRREQSEWVGVELPVSGGARQLSIADEAVLAGGYRVRREPFHGESVPSVKQTIAVVVDRSYSMGRVREELARTLKSVTALGPMSDVDLFLSSAPSRGEPPERVDDPSTAGERALSLHGGGSLKQVLHQFDSLRQNTVYDAVFVLTDDDSFDSADDSPPPGRIDSPLWIVHLGGNLAAGYDDATTELLQRTGGGVATRWEDAIIRHQARSSSASTLLVDSQSRWTVERTDAPPSPVNAFTQVAARLMITSEGRKVTSGNLDGLDQLHAWAKQYAVVTPWSSMIVLVEDRQRLALAEAEAQADRFQRTSESGTEALRAPSNPLSISATPEPHEWLLIGLAVAAGWVTLRQRRARPPSVCAR